MEIEKLTGLTSGQIERLRQLLSSIEKTTSDSQKSLFALLIKCLSNMQLVTSSIDENSSYFIKFRAESFKNFLHEISNGQQQVITVNAIESILYDFYALHLEHLLLTSRHGDLFSELQAYIARNQDAVSSNTDAARIYYLYTLPILIQGHLFQAGSVQMKQMIGETVESVKARAEVVDGWNASMNGWTTKVNKLSENLKQQTEKLSFVGLSLAFNNLSKDKARERNFHGTASILLAILLVAVPSLSIYAAINKYVDFQGAPFNWLPLLAVELVLLFLMRVVLQQFASAKAQLLQVRHRKELCAFIEGYATFIERIRADAGQDTLSKFESIIFSGISPDPSNVPNHFDGLEHIGKLVNEIRGKT